MGKIELDNLLNTRDLGGLKTIHGYKIKKKRIILRVVGKYWFINQFQLIILK